MESHSTVAPLRPAGALRSSYDVIELNPIRYPFALEYFDMGCANTWFPKEIPLGEDVEDWNSRLSDTERHYVRWMLGFFCTAESLVANNLAMAIYPHVPIPEARLYLGRQMYEEMNHTITFDYVIKTLNLDRGELYRMHASSPEIAAKEHFETKLTRGLLEPAPSDGAESVANLIRNLVGYYVVMEGIFFFSGFLMGLSFERRRLLKGLGTLIRYALKDETIHLAFGVDLISALTAEHPEVMTPVVPQQPRQLPLETRPPGGGSRAGRGGGGPASAAGRRQSPGLHPRPRHLSEQCGTLPFRSRPPGGGSRAGRGGGGPAPAAGRRQSPGLHPRPRHLSSQPGQLPLKSRPFARGPGAGRGSGGLRRQLAAANPQVFTPDLAGSLNNLAGFLSSLGRREEALGPAEKAVDLYRQLAAANPKAFTPDLAMSLGTLYCTSMGAALWDPAPDVNAEAVQLFATLAQGLPAVYGVHLRAALEDRFTLLTSIGDHKEELDELKRLLET